jgi:hypothetical protein
MSPCRRARSAVLVAVVTAAGYAAPAAVPAAAALAHATFHLLEHHHEEHALATERAAHDHDSRPADEHARAHSHGDGSAPHTHAAPVDALLALAETDTAPTIAPSPAPPLRVGGHVPASEVSLPRSTPTAFVMVHDQPPARSDWKPRPSVPPPRSIRPSLRSRS